MNNTKVEKFLYYKIILSDMVELIEIYNRLEEEFGFQNWWPASNKFEMMIGAILTQNVNWKNVETALDNLKYNNLIDPESIYNTNIEKIQKLIKPTGFYKQKSERLKRLSRRILNFEDINEFLNQDDLRDSLLNIKGIGPETADSIILYGAKKPIFVVDAYTKRIIRRILDLKGNYNEVQEFFESNLNKDVELYQEFHALLVELGKRYCRPDPKCKMCPIKKLCFYYKNEIES